MRDEARLAVCLRKGIVALAIIEPNSPIIVKRHYLYRRRSGSSDAQWLHQRLSRTIDRYAIRHLVLELRAHHWQTTRSTEVETVEAMLTKRHRLRITHMSFVHARAAILGNDAVRSAELYYALIAKYPELASHVTILERTNRICMSEHWNVVKLQAAALALAAS